MEAYLDKSNADYDCESLRYIRESLKYAKEWGLESEVVLFALRYAMEHPDTTFADCMDYGISEWVK